MKERGMKIRREGGRRFCNGFLYDIDMYLCLDEFNVWKLVL